MSKRRIGLEPEVIQTGGEIDGMVMSLIEAAYDKDEKPRNAIRCSIEAIGKKQPTLVLSTCEYFLHKNKQLVQEHRIILLVVMKAIMNDVATVQSLAPELVLRLVKIAISEMTARVEIVPEWQAAASELITALGAVFGKIVLDEVKVLIKPGELPHFYVIQTIGDFASNNVFTVVPALEEIIGRALPLVGMMKFDNMRWVFTTTIQKFCEAILNYICNLERAPNKDITPSRYSLQIFSIFEIFF